MLNQPDESSEQSASILRQIQNGLVQNKSFNQTFRIVTEPIADPSKIKEITGNASPDDTVLPDSDEEIGPA
ncbi:MAG: hypothetical protein AAF085_11750, partial [Planctomycetota bacterium]